jgi:hypothetical protein
MATTSNENKLDFVEGVSFLPWDWRNLGTVFGDGRPAHAQCVAARCRFTLRRGFDALDGADYGRVVEGGGDVGLNLRAGGLAFHLGASNLAYKAGDDAPLAVAGAAAGGARLAGLRLAIGCELAEDTYAVAGYDVIQKRPELSIGWSGATFDERSTLSLHFDPVDRVARLRAGVAFLGPEWRVDVYDEVSRTVQAPADDGCRHAVWVEHEARRRDLLAGTRVGARVDLGRLLNWAADYVDYNLEGRIPRIFWKLPFSQSLYNLVIPAEDAEQMRYRLHGLALEFSHDFARAAPTVGLSKRVGALGRAAVVYDAEGRAAEASLRLGGLVGAVTVTRAAGAGWKQWSSPSFSMMVEPLAFL